MFAMLPKIYNIFFVNSILGLSALLIGFDICSLYPLGSKSAFIGFVDNPLDQGANFVFALNQLSASGGCFLALPLLDAVGRVKCMQFSFLIWIIGNLIVLWSDNIWISAVSIAAKGLSSGLLYCSLPLYISEATPEKQLVPLISAVLLSTKFGSWVMFSIGYVNVIFGNESSFGIAWKLEMITAVLLLLSGFFLPESPNFLASKARWGEAARVFERLRGGNISMSNGYDRKSVVKNQKTVEKVSQALQDGTSSSSFRFLFFSELRQKTLLMFALQAFAQILGYNSFSQIYSSICDLTGITDGMRMLTVFLYHSIFVVFSLVPVIAMAGVKRKLALTQGIFLLFVTDLIVAYHILREGHFSPVPVEEIRLKGLAASLTLSASMLSAAVFSSTILPCAILYCIEVLPTSSHVKGFSTAMLVSLLTKGILSALSHLVLAYVGIYIYIVYAAMSFLWCLLVLLDYPNLNRHHKK